MSYIMSMNIAILIFTYITILSFVNVHSVYTISNIEIIKVH